MGQGFDLSPDRQTGIAFVHSLGIRAKIAACLGLAFTLTPLAAAQQFQTPSMPASPPVEIVQQALQSKIAHAEAMRAQMLRAQQEQGADSGYAAKAFQAQQNYLAEQAYLEYTAYLKKQIESQPPVANQTAYGEPAKRLPRPAQTAPTHQVVAAVYSQTPNFASTQKQPGTFVPPVHVAPQFNSGVVNFGDEPKATQAGQQFAFAKAESVPAPAPRGQIVQDEYIFQENGSIGLQDRITGLLFEPRYHGPSSAPRDSVQPRSATSSAPRQQVPPAQAYPVRMVQAAPTAAVPEHVRRQPRQPLFAPQGNIRRIPELSQDQNKNDVRHAFEIQRQMEQAIQGRQTPARQEPVRQVAMVTPAQDPFNDHSITLPNSISRPQLTAPQSADGRRGPMKQISILSRGPKSQPRQEQGAAQDGSQFGQGNQEFGRPSEDQSTQPGQGLSGSDPQEGIRKIDDDLNRRLKEMEQQSTNPNQLRVDRLVDELEKEMQESKDPSRGNSVADELADGSADEDQSNEVPERSCEEFRDELLAGSIRDISLDISPPGSENRFQDVAISRSWTDRTGNIIATGTMVDLRRGYVIIDGANGQQKVPYSKLSDADWAAVSEYWRIPKLCSVGNYGDASRYWTPQTYAWKASSVCHKPLFFEDIQLERYGHSHGPFTQPIRSVGHFFVSLFFVPYQSAMTPANECQYALGFYRPGNCAPWLKDPIPISLRGVARQALVTTGIGLIP